MKLYHETSSANAASIAVEGIKPRRGAGNWAGVGQGSSIENHVYLMDCENINFDFYATRTALITSSDCARIEVDVNGDNLYPDENMFIDGLVDVAGLKEAQQSALKNKSQWKKSLDERAAVSHRGPINTDRIVNITTYPIEESRYFCFVSGMPKRTIEYFDMVFHAFLCMSHNAWGEFQRMGFNTNREFLDGQFTLDGTEIHFHHTCLPKYVRMDLSGYMRNTNMI